MRIVCFILIFLTALVAADEQARIRVGRRFVDDVLTTFMPQIIQQVNNLSSFDYNLDMQLLKIFPIHFNVKNFTIANVTLNRSQYSFNFNPKTSSIEVDIKNLKINISSLIYHKILFFSNSSGSLNADMNLNLQVSLTVNSDNNGNIKLGLNNYNFNYKGSSISFKGGLFEWNVQTILNTFEFVTEFIINQLLKSGINSALTSINNNLQTQFEIPKTNSKFQIKVQDKITVDSDHLDLAAKILFKFNSTQKNLRILEQVNEMDDTEDLKILVNHDLMNSISKAFFIENIFNINFTSNRIPENIPFKINTKYFRYIIPGIYDNYPDEELIINLKATQLPSFLFNKLNQSIEFSTQALFSFSLAKQPEKSIFSFDSDIFLNAGLGANFTDSSVHLTLNKIEIKNMKIVISEFSDMDIDLLKSNLNFTFEIICNAANRFYLVNGIPLPIIKGLIFKKINIQVEDTFLSLTIETDVNSSKFNWLKIN